MDRHDKKRINDFQKDLEKLINSHSLENLCNTPDFVLAHHLTDSLLTYIKTDNAKTAFLVNE